LYQVDNLARSVDAALATERFTMFLLVAFAEVALLLASVGIFGVLSSDVAARRREIGIRIALGAGASNVVGLLLRRALSRAVVGIAAGSLLALVLARSMSALLFGVSANDPLTFLSAAGCVLMVTVVATLMPACHAVLASPLQALREG
jgi:ABC-type antimicrobial peptide transport system permease subunit